MHTRDTVLTIPNRHPFVSVGMPDRDTHWLCIPSHLAAAQLLAQVPPGVLGELAGLAEGDTLGAIRTAGPAALSALGALIGLAWSHPTLAIDAERGDDLIAFGGLVYEELHGAGYTLSEIVMLGLIVLQEVFEGAEIEAEVQERVAFFGRPRAVQTSKTA